MAIYEGTVRIRLHPKKGITLDKGNDTSTLTAGDAEQILTTMVSAAKQHKVGIDRWSLYIPELAAKLAKDAAQIPPAKVESFMDGSKTAVVTTDKFGKPRLLLAAPIKTVRKSAIVDIA